MKILRLTRENQVSIISAAVECLKNGGLVVYPTETTYGVGADCEDPKSIGKLLAYKSKRDGKPLSVAVVNMKMAEKYVRLNETAKNIYRNFLPGPVTVISKGADRTAKGVASPTGAIGIRIPGYQFALDLIKTYGKGITATGANASYQKRPYSVQDIIDNISEKQKGMLDLVIDAGELPHNEPSTIIDTTLDDIAVKRFGNISFIHEEKQTSRGERETEEIAQELVSRYRSKLTYSPLIFALTGEMGAGKTHFTKGIAKGLGISETVVSPTYTLASEYDFTSESRKGLFLHVDTWRMETAAELDQLKLQEYLDRNAVLAVEWADKFYQNLQALGKHAKVIWVRLETIADEERLITVAH